MQLSIGPLTLPPFSARAPRTVALLLCFVGLIAAAPAQAPRFRDAALPLDERVEDLLSRLTLEEKIALVHADTKFTNAGVPRLGIPPLRMSDGPHGVREEISPDSWKPAGRTDDFATALPVGAALAATWNVDLARAYGGVIAAEARQRGKHIMLTPGVNIVRTPLGGRNFEYFGEDPWLASRFAVATIQGLQAGDVAACVKHFALNNQERYRGSIDVVVSERALRELYLPAFEAAVREAGVLSVMGAYNKYLGAHCCENDRLLNRILKGEWGFRGLVMSDWNAVHGTREAFLGGLDLEMGTRKPFDEFYFARPLLEAVKRGDLPLAPLDDKVRRNLRVLLATRALDGRAPGAMNTPEHQAVARQVAAESIVLLKNSADLLPLDLARVKTIAVIGDNATRLQCHAGGSSAIKALYEITPLAGIIERVGGRATVIHAAGYQPPVERGTGKIDAAGIAQTELDAAAEKAAANELIDRAVAAARLADVAIVVGGLNHGRDQDAEGADRLSLALPFGQDELIARVAAANPHTVVVLVAGSPVAMDPWLERPPSVVLAWYGGMEAGHALADVLFGDVNPSGKLPVTFPRRLADSPTHASGSVRNYPGENGRVFYDEDLLVGYRWFDAKAIEPLFPFGHGLSYTKFDFSPLRVSSTGSGADLRVTVECEVRNSGLRAGAEVVQLYIEPVGADVERPPQELKAFAKVALAPGESKPVRLTLDARSFATYDPTVSAWRVAAAAFRLHVGGSSRDRRQTVEFHPPAAVVLPR
ncbi:MAG: glycoside hydrolase family 3 C-terminal domain-containing protein [Opitutae bacterium]|nr:glycoside hydrolase family 3 C-terminal domain-containing protein [Opitutae bacterium]